ncbi:MAG: lipid A export permease/ATP-binding protein MsbA [Gammaproteobacteria bacterium]|nr:lipid A export permease/ATP-binding protein MsbA [Gammaproteobacteria bacterium]
MKEQTAPLTANTSGIRTYSRLLLYTKRYWLLFMLSVVGNIFYAATEPAFAWLMKPMVDGSFVDKDPATIKFVPLALLAIFIVRGVAGFVSNYYMAWIGWQIVAAMRREMFGHLLRMPTAIFDQSTTGELISKLTFNVERVSGAATNAFTIVVRDSMTVLGLLALLFYYDVVLSLVFLVVGPVIGILVVLITRQFRRTSGKIQGSMGKVTHVVQEAIEGHRVVKIFGGQSYEDEQFEQVNERNRRLRMRMIVAEATSVPIVQLLVAAALALIVYLASIKSVVDSFSAGTFISFIIAMLMLFGPLKRLTTVNAKLQEGIAASESVFELIDAESEPDSGSRVLQRPGVIEYRDVSFAYDSSESKVLDSVNIKVAPEQTVAFVGRSGAGKTTLVNLLARFYELREGSILIDDVDIREFTLNSLRDHIAYVGQNVTLFNDTVFNNIAYGKLGEASEADVKRAAEAAHADEFIRELPEQYDTLVGENGVLLSGGQRQRLAIARALLKDAPLLILDEATSALDSESEKHVQAGLSALVENRTTFVIAHRLSTIEGADLIVVLDGGRIVEAGSHAELLDRGGYYATLYNIQFGEVGTDAPVTLSH